MYLVLGADILQSTDLLLPHRSHDGHHEILTLTETILELSQELVVGWQTQVVLGNTTVSKEGHKSILGDIDELVVGTHDLGNITIVRRRHDILELLPGEDIDTDEVTFSVTVLAGLGSRNLNNLAGSLLDHDVRILTDGTSLLGEGLGRSGVSLGLEVVLIIRHSGRL